MEFYLSKILNYLINPFHILFFVILTQLLIIFFIKSKKLIIFFSKLFLVLFLFFGYVPLSNFLLNKIEDYIQPSKYPVQKLTGVVVLGAGFDSGKISKERNQIALDHSASRLTKAIEIYNKNPNILILLSGFSKDSSNEGWSDLEMVQKFYLDQGVRLENLIFEDQSKNTYENALFSKNILSKYKGTWGLITTASHMPRSYILFKKQGLILEPINVNYRTGTTKIFWLDFNIKKGLIDWSIIFHEIIGLAYYKITNKI
jgi:uncharacterized SAM-binding protein YcdF (DUF218 family)